MRGRGILGAIVLVWLIIGVIAVFQRGYFSSGDTSCNTLGNVAVTVIAGPLNYKILDYMGYHPDVNCHKPNVPQPS